MNEITVWMRLSQNLIDRISGSMNFRFYLQPVIALIFAIVAGLNDAKTGKPPYFWSLLTGRARRLDRIKDGWKSVGKVVVVALTLDIAYQIIVLRFVYPGEVVIIAFIVVIAPYLVLRGLVTRLAARK
jgi:hypothetical protein